MKLISIEECCSLIRNGASIKQSSNASGIPITRIETIATGCINFDKVGYANIFDEVRFKEYYLKSGDILMSHINSIKHLGKTALVNVGLSNDIIHGMNLLLLRPLKSIDPSYLKYYFETKKFYNEILSISNQSVNQSSFTVTALKKIKIPLPPLSTQKAIAEKLDRADALRKKDKELLAQYDELAQAIFIDMFGDPVRNEKGWKTDTLKNVCSKIGSGSTPKGGKENYKTDGISLIRSMNVYDREFLYKDLAYIDDIQADKLKNVVVEAGDILFNITGASVCRSSIVPNDILPARVNQHVSIIRPKLQFLNNYFLSNLLIADQVKMQLLKIGSGGGAVMEAITKEQLEKYTVIIPALEMQKEFAEKIKNIEAQKAIVKQQAQQSEDLFQALLQESFNFNQTQHEKPQTALSGA